jgi:hypothetical protein
MKIPTEKITGIIQRLEEQLTFSDMFWLLMFFIILTFLTGLVNIGK